MTSEQQKLLLMEVEGFINLCGICPQILDTAYAGTLSTETVPHVTGEVMPVPEVENMVLS